MRPTFSTRRLAPAAAAAVLASGLAVSAGGAVQAQGPAVHGANHPDAIPGSYVVTLDDGLTAAATADAVSELARDYEAEVTRIYSSALNGFAAEMSATEAAALAADPAVAKVQSDRELRLLEDTQPNPPSWGLDRIDQRSLPLDSSYTYPNGGEGVTAYIIDTGVRQTHNEFGGRARAGYDAVNPGGDASDCNGHGTHVAGTVAGESYGVAKNADVVAVRVLDCQGSGTLAGVVAGVDWVTDDAQKPAVANMSLGGGIDSTLDQAVRNSIAGGVTYALAAGNSGQQGDPDACNGSPGRVGEALTVASSTNGDSRSGFSSWGSCVDLFAPGSNITSAWYDGDNSTNTISGTSMATPHVAGAAAMYLSANPQAAPSEVAQQINANATPDVISDPRAGTPNRLLYVGFIDGGQPPADDFAVSVAPDRIELDPGQSGQATVSTQTTSGDDQTVDLSVSGAPAGVEVTVDPGSVVTGDDAQLSVTTSASTPEGAHTLTVVGSGSVDRSATLTLVVGDDDGGQTTWQEWTAYAVGDRVTYDGTAYVCRIAHTSLPGWDPPNVPALWAPDDDVPPTG